jgi:hypothetical protein
MEKEQLLADFETEFERIRDELNFKPTLQELEPIFGFKDYILQLNFISPNLSRVICARIRDTFNFIAQQIQGWLMPNSYSMVGISESQVFDDKEKKEMTRIIDKVMAYNSENIIIGLTQNKKKEADYINHSVVLWSELLPEVVKYNEKVHNYWKDQAKNGNNSN